MTKLEKMERKYARADFNAHSGRRQDARSYRASMRAVESYRIVSRQLSELRAAIARAEVEAR